MLFFNSKFQFSVKMSKRTLPERAAKAKKPRIEQQKVELEEQEIERPYENLSELEKLPDEIAEKVIESMSAQDVMKLSLVSRRMRNFIAGSFEARKKCWN